MFGLSNLQIYGLQPTSATSTETTNGMKMTANFLEKLIRNELLLGTNNNNSSNNNNNNNNIYNGSNNNNNNTNGNKLMDSNKLNQKQQTSNGNLDIYHQICNGTDDKENSNCNNNNNSNNGNKIDNGVTMNAITNKETNKDTINLKQTITKHNENDNEKESEKIFINNSNNDSSVRNSNEMANEMNATQNGTKVSLDKQRKKFMQMITFLDQQNQRLEIELAKEKRRRGEELSKIIKSLLCFEAKLKHDKKVINQKLYEKDSEICKLINLNKVLKEKFGAANNNENIDDDLEKIEENLRKEIQFCSNCRKKYYGLDKNHFGTQTYIEGDDFKDDQTEHGSSSDETVSSSFYGARRSIRYTSKRTFGTFRDYMRSRSMMVDDSNLDNSEENASTLSRDESQYSCFEKTNLYSRTIDRLHGIRRVESLDDDLDSESEVNRNENDEKYFHDEAFTSADKLILSTEKKCSAKEFAEISPKQEFEMSTDDWYASASDAEENENVRAKSYTYNAVNPVLECVNQILLQQSMEECLNDGPPSLESNENNSGSGVSSGNKENTVNRKRVHFSTKNSMVHVPRDDVSSPTDELEIPNQKDNSFNYESIYSNEYEPIGSEHNSSNLYVDMESKLGQDDRVIITVKPKPPALPPKPANLMKIRRVLRIPPQPCPLRKIDTKIEEKSESEPDYCSISEVNEAITSVQIVVDVHKPPVEDDQSDALSQKTDEVEEIFADIPKLPNVAAIMAPKAISRYINNDNYITKSSPNKDDSIKVTNKPSPAHIPKILADINKKIATSTPTSVVTVSSKPPPVPPYSPTKATISSPTAVISAAIASSSSIVTTPLSSGKIIPTEDKLPLQAEFDWYNLDVEYGKSNQPDVIKATDTILNNNNINNNNNNNNNNGRHHDNGKFKGINENNHQITHGVEYNLDEEFSLTNQPDIIKENVLESKICRNNSNSQTETVCEKFPTIVDQTPCTRRIKLRTDFTNFIENSGLSTKPLPRQRKIYFSGPFV